jgi:dTDP-4-dehydrorhamnose reductase
VTVLVTGANGQVGWEALRRGPDAGIDIIGLNRGQLDITDRRAVADAVDRVRPQAVINAAAYTPVDKAESEPDAAFAVNRDGPAHLAQACRDAGIPLVHISTDYIFDGTRDTPYGEDDPAAPINVYGQSKWAGEEALRGALNQHVILRVSWVFGVHGNNFVKTMLSLARRHDMLRIIADRSGCPTSAASIAAAALHIARLAMSAHTVPWGTYHYCGQPHTTWYGFAQTIFAQAIDIGLLEAVGTVTPIPGVDFPQPAPRPQNLILDCSKWRRHFDLPVPSWETDLAAMLRELHESGA